MEEKWWIPILTGTESVYILLCPASTPVDCCAVKIAHLSGHFCLVMSHTQA